MARKRATLTDLLNDLTFKVLYEKYKLLATSRFIYEGLPEGIESRHIESLLFENGQAIFFRDKDMSYMCLRADELGQYNVNGDPLRYSATGFNYNKQYDADDCIIIKNNILKIATDPFIMFYVNKLTEAERTMDVNVKVCKTPWIFACDDKDVLTFKRMFQQIDGNTPALYVDKGLNLNAIQVLKTEAKFLGNDLMDYKKSVENELLTFLGFNNMAVDKKERVNVEEAESNNQIIEAFSKLQLQAREDAVKEINKKYGLTISVKENVENSVEKVENGGDDDVENNTVRNNKTDSRAS